MAERPESNRPARYACPKCGAGDRLYGSTDRRCVYCGFKGPLVDRLRGVFRRIIGAERGRS